MTLSRHEPFEELISASLSGDLTTAERQRLDAHLDACGECRATLAAFADQRRIMSGLRHVGPPRDLGARVRTGIERGRFASLPWWRRPAVLVAGLGGGLAAVAGALLAIVLLNGVTDERGVGDASPTLTPVPSLAVSGSPAPTLPPAPTPAETGQPASVPASASSEPIPTATPVQASPEPDVFLALTGPFDNLGLTIRDGTTGETIAQPDTAGAPLAAELSPDGRWLAYVTQRGLSGLNDVRVTRIAEGPEGFASPVAVGETVMIGESVAGGPFLEHMFWSPDGRFLAFTIADPSSEATDVWVFQPSTGDAQQVTNVGNAYAASWVAGDGEPLLWVSSAGDRPVSHLVPFPADDSQTTITARDPASGPYPGAPDVFQPLVSPNGGLVIYWAGRMERSGAEWLFSEGGAPWLAENQPDGTRGYAFANARLLFSDVTVDRDAFRSAAIAWGGDSDAYAVWATDWSGVPQSADGDYPDRGRVYFGHATDPRGLTKSHAIDASDIPTDSSVVDVKVSPTGRHLVVSALRPLPGDLAPPQADLLLITRNTGDVADEVQVIGSADNGWFGPAAFDGTP